MTIILTAVTKTRFTLSENLVNVRTQTCTQFNYKVPKPSKQTHIRCVGGPNMVKYLLINISNCRYVLILLTKIQSKLSHCLRNAAIRTLYAISRQYSIASGQKNTYAKGACDS